MQHETLAFCQKHNILVEGWGALGSGKMFDRKELKYFSQKYERTVAQVCIRWSLKIKVLPLVKSISADRMQLRSLGNGKRLIC